MTLRRKRKEENKREKKIIERERGRFSTIAKEIKKIIEEREEEVGEREDKKEKRERNIRL